MQLSKKELLAGILELERKKRAATAYRDRLFDRQRAFLADPAKKKALLCGRRAGKTETIAAWLLDGAASDPGGHSAYIVPRRRSAKRTMWRVLKGIAHKTGLELVFKEGELECTHPNGHTITLFGCDDEAEVDKFRGAFHRRVAIDEAGSFGPFLQSLVQDSIEPTLWDLDGDLVIAGTPGPLPSGYFYAITTGQDVELRIKKWPTHCWTAAENPFMPKGLLEREREEKGWSEDHPTFVREYLGRWVTDLGALAFPYDREINTYDGTLPEDVRYVLGVDLGSSKTSRTTAFVLLAYKYGFREVFVVSSEKHAGMIPSKMAVKLREYRESLPNLRIIMDAGGLGGSHVDEFVTVYGLPVEAAEKSGRLSAQEMARGALISGNVKIDPKKNKDLLDEFAALSLEDYVNGVGIDHCCDSFSYSFRQCKTGDRPWFSKPADPPKKGTREWYEAEAKRMKAAKARQMKLKKTTPFWRTR